MNYIINDDELYLSESNYYAEVGSFVHEILEMIFNGNLNVEDALDYYINHYNDYVCYKVKESTMNRTFETIADYFASLDINWLKDYEILGVELKTDFKLDDYNFVGFIDLLLRDKRDGKIVVLDHKSSDYPFKQNGEVKKNSQHNFELYKKQMYLYCKSVFDKYKEYPARIVWNHFKDGGKFAEVPFVKSEYNEVIKWFVDMVDTIRKEKDFKPTQNFFYCSQLCNFRNSCEYRKFSVEQGG